jgi:hypothetical protein
MTLFAISMGLFLFSGDKPAHWDWQLTEPFDLSVNVQTLVLDADSFDEGEIGALRARGVKPICYISVGTREDYRDDAAYFPPEVIGKQLGNWPDEVYLDIRQKDIIMPIMKARINRCRSLGFQGVEADNIDLHNNDTGFDIGIPEVIAYSTALARYAHEIGMEIGQKNAPGLAPLLVKYFDFMMVEECFKWDFCEETAPYLDAGKTVLAVEYTESNQDWDVVCAKAKEIGLHMLIKEYEITAGGRACE